MRASWSFASASLARSFSMISGAAFDKKPGFESFLSSLVTSPDSFFCSLAGARARLEVDHAGEHAVHLGAVDDHRCAFRGLFGTTGHGEVATRAS